jgi:adenylate cyclase
VALAQNFLARPTLITNVQAFAVVLAAFLTVVMVGVMVANRITQPLMQMVRASTEVARGNFEIKVTPSGDDEVAVMGHAFNYMVTGLQEGAIYRDLLGRTVSPEVREELRESFASGNLRLEGQTAIATVLMSDIRGFTTLSEHAEPTTILAWLNEYFSELVPVITARGGVVDKFEGDAILAVFGVLPRPVSAEESAYQASRAAVEMLRVVRRLNARRQARGEPLFVTGLGVNTGPVTAGGLGTADRLNYTVIGDTVNTTQRLESFTREFGESGAIISQSTYDALGARLSDFRLDALGAHTFKGKTEPLTIYRLWPSRIGPEANEAKDA